jgi:hypothetical protein
MDSDGAGSGGGVRQVAESVRARPHELITQRDTEAAFQLAGQALEAANRMRDVA